MKKDLHINILTYCDAIKNPERFEILKKSVSSLKKIKNNRVFISVWDNGSSSGVMNFLENLDFIDYIFKSRNNFFDVAPIRALKESSEVLGNNFVCHMEDDLEVIQADCVNEILNFLYNNDDVAGTRLTKFDVHKPEVYDKSKQNPNTDRSNMMSLYNAVDKSDILWEGPIVHGNFNFYKCNWHWYNFPIIAKVEFFKKIIPYGDVEPLQYQENLMRDNFYKLNKKLSILNGGVVTHLGTFDKKGSMRLFVREFLNKNVDGYHISGQFPVLKNTEINSEVERFILGLKKCLNQS